MQHNGPIHKFHLFIPYDYNFKIIIEFLSTWIPFLSRRDIKHLELLNYGTHVDQMPYTVLACFKRLLNLHLSNVTFESGALEGLISGCPLLEKLSIQFCEGFEYFDISVTTLKVLLLQFHQEMKSICLKKAINLIDLTLKATNGCVCIWFDQKFTKKHSKAFYWSMTRCLQDAVCKYHSSNAAKKLVQLHEVSEIG
ncbi:hypothetical protein MTR_7g090760 [Medicago truncatula]|uniref:F-box/LRR-repeat protein 15/At3g58940/PEG3-like LRR domain-containing protein n=1 Tax=Medicago truncatula TaxID=3880 RepID=G7KSK3_MEDTR|nr:hypothetical protein MTR_7g090760 [Medicago truncatula]